MIVSAAARRPAAARFALVALFAAFVLAGALASLRVGVTWDEAREQETFALTGAAVDGLLHGDLAGARAIQSYGDRYYGVGFHALAYPLQLALAPWVARSAGLDAANAMLLARHAAAFLAFALSVAVFYRLLRLFVRERLPAVVFTAAYALYPYLFGHGMVNVKDIPYLSAYLLCTFLSIRLARHHLDGATGSLRADGLALVLATALLASIRIPGLLIVAQYLFTFALVDRATGSASPPRAPLLRARSVTGFLAILLALVVAAYPVMWLDPLGGLIGAAEYMGGHPWVGCTLTWGTCMDAQDLPASYVPGWLVVKLPLLVLLGLAAAPFAYPRIAPDPLRRVAFLTLVFGAFYLVAWAVLARTPLYDETRQLLFVYPLMFLLACVALHALSRPLSLAAAALSVALFAWDDVALHPYQYVWFNGAARFLDIDRLFLTDYWAESGREMGRLIDGRPEITRDTECIYASPFDHYRPFIAAGQCVKPFAEFNREPPTGQYVFAFHTRLRFRVPGICRQVAEVARTFPLSGQKATMALAFRCHRRP
jgi:hypothetical protein